MRMSMTRMNGIFLSSTRCGQAQQLVFAVCAL